MPGSADAMQSPHEISNPETVSSSLLDFCGNLAGAVSMGGSNELVECFCGGAVAEGCSGAVARLVGDGV